MGDEEAVSRIRPKDVKNGSLWRRTDRVCPECGGDIYAEVISVLVRGGPTFKSVACVECPYSMERMPPRTNGDKGSEQPDMFPESAFEPAPDYVKPKKRRHRIAS